MILSPVLARPGASPKSRCSCTSAHIGQAQVPGQGGRKEQPSVGHQAVVVEGDTDAVGVAAW